jgi:GNAT superfamily N-acetyltransferase
MPTYHLTNLNREAYKDSIATITDTKSAGFAKMALEWWDRHFSWKPHGCVALSDEHDAHLCYIFYKIDRYKEYMTIHNIFTPHPHRRMGYAKILLKRVFAQASDARVSRFRFVSVPQSLDFYLSMGFVYWGINSVGDYYCDLPLPENGLEGIKSMIEESDLETLIGASFETIYSKIGGNENLLSQEQHLGFESDKVKMHKHYLNDAFMASRTTSGLR